eukprot:6911904-Alexandrium_andersonii.AAC.1
MKRPYPLEPLEPEPALPAQPARARPHADGPSSIRELLNYPAAVIHDVRADPARKGRLADNL